MRGTPDGHASERRVGASSGAGFLVDAGLHRLWPSVRAYPPRPRRNPEASAWGAAPRIKRRTPGLDKVLRTVREVLQQVRVTRHDNLVVSVDAGGRIRVLEALLGVAHREHVDAVPASQIQLFE